MNLGKNNHILECSYFFTSTLSFLTQRACPRRKEEKRMLVISKGKRRTPDFSELVTLIHLVWLHFSLPALTE